MANLLFRFIRPFLIITLLLASSSSAGVFLQLDARTETRAMDALVRFLPHTDSSSSIADSGTFAKVQLSIPMDRQPITALETTPPAGSMTARLELVSASGLAVTDNLRIFLDPGSSRPTPMIEVQNGAVTQMTGAALSLSELENARIEYTPGKGLTATADVGVDLVLTPEGFDGFELRYRFHLLGALAGAPEPGLRLA